MTRPLPPGYAGFFDPIFYQTQLGTSLPNPLGHYRRRGDAMGLDPSPYFSTRYYKARYPAWGATGARSALDDFLAQEALANWRSPHPLIQPEDYLRRYPDVAQKSASPAAHFVTHGDGEGRSPSEGFDAGFYRSSYLSLGQAHAFRHYVMQGQKAGCLPKPTPRSFEASHAAAAQIAQACADLVIFCVHDAQEAGTPILVLDLAHDCVRRGKAVCFVLKAGGPLLSAFQAKGPVFLQSEGWDAAGLFAGFGKGAQVLVHSAAAAGLATAAAGQGARCALLIHEMRGYLDAQGMMPDLARAKAAGAVLVASFPRMAAALQKDLGTLPVVRPGIRLPDASLQAFRVQRRAAAKAPVFISAGHADRRKGFDRYLAAARAIRARMPQARFVWLGALDPWAQDLARTALGEGLPLGLPGFVTTSVAWYAASTVYLLTSREDPGPSTLIHAAATGTPFVGYASEIGLQGVADPLGRFVPDGDLDAFVEAACHFAGTETVQTRRARRKLLAPHLGMAGYCEALLSLVP